MHDGRAAQVGQRAEREDQRAGGDVGDVRVRQGRGEGEVGGWAVPRTAGGRDVGDAVGVGGIVAGGSSWGRGVQVAVCEDGAVFVVAAHAGGVVFDEDVEDGWGGGPAGNGVASGDEVVGFGVEGHGFEERLYLEVSVGRLWNGSVANERNLGSNEAVPCFFKMQSSLECDWSAYSLIFRNESDVQWRRLTKIASTAQKDLEALCRTWSSTKAMPKPIPQKGVTLTFINAPMYVPHNNQPPSFRARLPAPGHQLPIQLHNLRHPLKPNPHIRSEPPALIEPARTQALPQEIPILQVRREVVHPRGPAERQQHQVQRGPAAERTAAQVTRAGRAEQVLRVPATVVRVRGLARVLVRPAGALPVVLDVRDERLARAAGVVERVGDAGVRAGEGRAVHCCALAGWSMGPAAWRMLVRWGFGRGGVRWRWAASVVCYFVDGVVRVSRV